MSTYQRVALFILFDAIEADLISHIRMLATDNGFLAEEEREKAKRRLGQRSSETDLGDDLQLIHGLDLGDKFSVLMRLKPRMDAGSRAYFGSLNGPFQRMVGIRNDVMHGRPMTLDQQVLALSFAQNLVRSGAYWSTLLRRYAEYTENPTAFMERSIEFLDEPIASEVLHNLPVPDYDDTGFLPRPELERDLRKKILGRHPVVTVLGEGGNGKTALTLQVLYSLVRSADHPFDAIIWTSAKTSHLIVNGVSQVEDATVEALEIMDAAAMLEASPGDARTRLMRFLEDNRVLLVVDNYETIVGSELKDLVSDVPGESKIVFTSRHPIGGDLTVLVGELSPKDALVYINRLADVYAVEKLKAFPQTALERFVERLSFKPLLIKWLVLGVKSGLDPERITLEPDSALKFCLDNVILKLGPEAQAVIVVLSALPTIASPGVIQSVSNLSPIQVTDGLAELTRYGLVELEVSPDGSQEFSLKSFSRSYVHRLIVPRKDVVERILENYRRIEGEYQSERNRVKANRYSRRNFVVRNRSEMIVANRLKTAISYGFDGEFDLAEQYLQEAKALEPAYFEVHRVEAFIAEIGNDWTRAVSSLETALRLEAEEPQIHFYLATLFMKLLDNDRAARHFENCLEIDPRPMVLREAARNEYMRCNFEDSQRLITLALDAIGPGQSDEYLRAVDVQIQLFVRKLEWGLSGDETSIPVSAARDLIKYLRSISQELFDDRMLGHLRKAIPQLIEMRRRGLDVESADEILRIIDAITRGEKPASGAGSSEGQHIGCLKEIGRREDYGFLESQTCPDSFIHITRVPAPLWDLMVAGEPVRFDSEVDSDGRRYAHNISPL